MRIAGFLLLMLLYAAMYSFPALTPAMAKEFGTSRSALQGAFAVWSLAIAALAPFAGRSVDRHGLRRTLTTGVAFLVGTLIGLGMARAPWQVYAALIGLGAPAYSLLQIATLVAAGRTGARHRGNAFGLAGAGIGAGLAFLLPGTLWLSGAQGWRAALLLLGGVSAVIGFPAVMTVVRSRVAAPAGDADLSLGGLLRSRIFLLLFVGGIMIGLFDEALYQHLVPHLQTLGFSAALGGTILGCASVGYMGGQVVGGSLSDRVGRWSIGAVAALLTSAGLAAFMASLGNAGWFLAAFAAGFGLGATIAVRSAVLTDMFEGPSLGLVTGTYQWSYAIGAAAMSWVGPYAYERSGSYASIFAVSAAAAILWMVFFRAALTIQARQRPSPSVARLPGPAR